MIVSCVGRRTTRAVLGVFCTPGRGDTPLLSRRHWIARARQAE
jgi:hypothetical protein